VDNNIILILKLITEKNMRVLSSESLCTEWQKWA